jgi:hypothetical protein
LGLTRFSDDHSDRRRPESPVVTGDLPASVLPVPVPPEEPHPPLAARSVRGEFAHMGPLPERTISNTGPESYLRRCSFARRSRSSQSPTTALAQRPVRHGTANRGPLPLCTSWGTTPRGRFRSPRHICGSPARYGRPREHRRPRRARSVHPDDARIDRAGRFPSGRGGTARARTAGSSQCGSAPGGRGLSTDLSPARATGRCPQRPRGRGDH